MISEKVELVIKSLVLLAVVLIFLFSFSIKGHKYLRPFVMALVAAGAIIDLMGKLGKGVLFSLLFIAITVLVIIEKEEKINKHENS